MNLYIFSHIDTDIMETDSVIAIAETCPDAIQCILGQVSDNYTPSNQDMNELENDLRHMMPRIIPIDDEKCFAVVDL